MSINTKIYIQKQNRKKRGSQLCLSRIRGLALPIPEDKQCQTPTQYAYNHNQLYANVDVDFALSLRVFMKLRVSDAADKTPFNVLSIMSCHLPKPNEIKMLKAFLTRQVFGKRQCKNTLFLWIDKINSSFEKKCSFL